MRTMLVLALLAFAMPAYAANHAVQIKGMKFNPSKISGMCGRLMCCLAYEDEGGRPAQEQPPATLENGQNISAEAPV